MMRARMPPERLLNLNFHGIGAPTERPFGPGEAEFWATQETFEATLDLAQSRPGEISLSFDDGNTTDLTVALPALEQRNLTATFFIVAGWLGTRPGFIKPEDLHKLVNNGMTIGNHGLQHLRWTELDRAALQHETTEGQRRLEQITQTRIETAALPYGAYNQNVLSTLKAQGYTHVYSSTPGTADPNAWLQPRTHVKASDTPETIEALLKRSS